MAANDDHIPSRYTNFRLRQAEGFLQAAADAVTSHRIALLAADGKAYPCAKLSVSLFAVLQNHGARDHLVAGSGNMQKLLTLFEAGHHSVRGVEKFRRSGAYALWRGA